MRGRVLITVGVIVAVAALLLLRGGFAESGSPEPKAGSRSPRGAGASPTQSGGAGGSGAAVPPGLAAPDAAALRSAAPVSCPAATVTVGSADELISALRDAVPGASIRLSDGTYGGRFVTQRSGTEEQPIWLCGGRGAVLDGGGTDHGYALHLDHAERWRLVGFGVRNAQKGVMADAATGSVLQDLLVESIGDEAIHLRAASSHNVVLRNTVRGTGLRNEKFGEGIYIGSASSNWAMYSSGGPDRSDDNVVQGNTISDTTSESVDVKEGTSGCAVIGNSFDGSRTTAADSWLDLKGNGWLVADNTGSHTGKDGYQTHQVVDGWGAGNVFRRNVAATRGSGVDVYVHKPDRTQNAVFCDNSAGAGRPASSNVPCLP